MRIHADVEIEHDENRRLQPLGEVEGARRELEGFARTVRDEEDMLGVAVRGEGAQEKIRLLGAGRHAGRRSAALDVEDDDRDLGEIGEPEEFLHERDARPRGRGEGARAVPASAHRHADGGDLVLGLDNGVVLPARRRIDAKPGAIALEGFGQRGRGGDRVPGADGRPAIDRAEASGEIALDQNAVADGAAAAHADVERTIEPGLRLVAAEAERPEVRFDQPLLALELLGDELLDDRKIDVEQRRQRADIDDVLDTVGAVSARNIRPCRFR